MYPRNIPEPSEKRMMIHDTERTLQLREEMVAQQIEARGITDRRVLRAMRVVPRHVFVDESHRHEAYSDYPLPIGEGQTISQPFIVAEMTQALALDPEDKVLEIGTGSGYQTAVLAEIVQSVCTVERIESLYLRATQLLQSLGYRNILMRLSDGTLGWAEQGPFDAILVTAGAPHVPRSLLQQLKEGGRMVIPVGDRFSQELLKIVKTERGIHQTGLGGCRFVKLVGEHGWNR